MREVSFVVLLSRFKKQFQFCFHDVLSLTGNADRSQYQEKIGKNE